MATLSEAGSKICTSCGEDVAGKPRTKDARGRYFCKPCYERATTKAKFAAASRTAPVAAPPHPAADDDADILAGLGGGSSAAPTALKACPGCRGGLPADAVLCTNCGFDSRTGKKAQMQISQTTVEARTKASRGGMKLGLPEFLTNPVTIGLGLFAFYGGCMWLALATPNMAALAVAVGFLVVFAVHLWVTIVAFMDGILTGLLTLFIPFYAVYFVFTKSDNPYIKAAYIPTIIFGVIFRFVANFGGAAMLSGPGAGGFADESALIEIVDQSGDQPAEP